MNIKDICYECRYATSKKEDSYYPCHTLECPAYGGKKLPPKVKVHKYLGEKEISIKGTPFEYYDKSDWAMYFIECYGQIDGSRYKSWVLDQVSRILNGTPVIVSLATWDNGEREYRVKTGNPSFKYKNWVKSMLGEFNEDEEEYEYSYYEGIAP
jgi:hypothetical protein